ncbi:MAG: pyrroline-5-carboxylate reductase [Candidatus Omnitrophica bacterium]|nr:pyrroline-5-carboxylate reductase [Candidatus Omnitrophota bacterium]
MGRALIRGLLRAGVPSGRVVVAEADASTRQRVRRAFRVRGALLDEMARRCDVIVIAVKPQDLPPVLDQLARGLRARGPARPGSRGAGGRQPLVISIAAGVRLAALEGRLSRVPVVRVMPNLPAKVGCGISAMATGRAVGASHLAIARAIFGCVGEVVELPERLFDAVTAISGSGPAYFFLIFKALRDAGSRAGLPNAIAQRLALRTASGSVALAEASSQPLEDLIAQVASKRGTTEAALNVFRRYRLAESIQAGVAAAVRRSRALSKEHRGR